MLLRSSKLHIRIILVFVLCGCCFQFVESDNILFIGTIFSGSHLLTLRQLAKALVADGHQVKFLRWKEAGHPLGKSNSNFTEIEMTLNNSRGSLPLISTEEHGGFQFRGKDMWQSGMTMSLFPLSAIATIRHMCDQMLGDERLFRELKEDHFSVAVVDLFFNECGLALAHKLGIPAVGFYAFHLAGGISMYTPAFNPPSSSPQIMSHLEAPMNIFQRTYNSLYMVLHFIYFQIEYALLYPVFRKHIPDSPYPSSLLANLSGVLINSNPSLNPPILLPPSYVEVAGMHITDPKKLPKDIEEFIESSGPFGVILFSLGIIFDAESISKEYFEAYFEVFGRFQQKVIVKSRRLPTKVPKNVLILPLLPQQDILAHNKTRLFITHCGMHSIIEAVHHEVPMVGIPIFIDQKDNLLRLLRLGVAQGLERDSGKEEIYAAIKEVLTNTSYKSSVVELKRKMAHNGDPLKKAKSLLDHVMATKGAEDLKMDSRHLNILQYLCIDLIFYAGILLCISYLTLFGVTRKIKLRPVKLKEA